MLALLGGAAWATSTIPSANLDARYDALKHRIDAAASANDITPDRATLLRAELGAIAGALDANDNAQAVRLLQDVEGDVDALQAARLRITVPAPETRVTMHVGERLTIAYGPELSWSGESSNTAVLARAIGVPLPLGVQGIFLAKAPGHAVLTFTGRAPSVPGEMHPDFVRLARIDVTVTP